MRKFLVFLLAVVVAFGLAACGGDGKTTEAADTGNAKNESSTADTTESPAQTSEVEQTPFDEVVVVDNDECVIKIEGIQPDGIWGYTIKVYLENKSEDKKYLFNVETAYINGVQTPVYFYDALAAGKKMKTEITFGADLDPYIPRENYSNIELEFSVSDNSDFSADPIVRERVNLYPLGAENAELYVRASQDTDNVVVDNDDTQIIVTGYEIDNYKNLNVQLYIVNKTDKVLTYALEDVSINSYMFEPFWGIMVGGGKRAYTTIVWPDTIIEEYNIASVDDVKEIEMTIKSFYETEDSIEFVLDEPITLNP